MIRAIPEQHKVTPFEADVCQLPLPESTPWSDATVLPAVYNVIMPYVTAAQEQYGSIPPLRSEEWADAPEPVKLASILIVGMAWIQCDPHRVVRHAFKQVALDIHGGDSEYWRRAAANHVPYDELRARRARPVYPAGQRAA